jgi:segregation and condensation protein B
MSESEEPIWDDETEESTSADSEVVESFSLDSEQDADEATEAEEEWPAGDLESAYRKALEANDAVEWEFDQLPDSSDESDEPSSTVPDGSEAAIASQHSETSNGDPDSEDAADPVEAALPQRISARSVVEAAVFVGGEPLTTKKLCYMFRGDYELDFIDEAISDLNRQYLKENRPYEIRLGEGGYRMLLRTEYERVRNRVFGIGPREVKLSQEVLEVLALVAYRQPITQAQIEKLGKANPGALLRQLLRRELISIERDPENPKQVKYVTTKRFLSLFGLGKLDELPQADELAFK